MIRGEDEAIERVLKGLGAAEAPGGMEHRIVSAIQERASADGTKRRRTGLFGLFPNRVRGDVFGLRGGLAVAGGMAVLFAVLVTVRVHTKPDQEPARSDLAVVAAHRGEGPRDVGPALPQASVRPAVTRQRRVGPLASRPISTGRAVRAVSYPAPVAPLSAQERALLVVARTGGPEEIAMLDPVVRARQEAEGEAEFERFAAQVRHE